MSTRTARRRLRIATALIAATLAGPGVATAATEDLRGEYAKDPGHRLAGRRAAPTSAASSRRSRRSSQRRPRARTLAASSPSPSTASTPSRAGSAPADSVEPSDAPSALPFIVAGLVALLGFAAIAVATTLRRRVRVSH